MSDQLELLSEAARRGILPEDKRALYEEAVRRGLIKSGGVSQAPVGAPTSDAAVAQPAAAGEAAPTDLMFHTGLEAENLKRLPGGMTQAADMIARGAANTATFGYADELAGLGNYLVGKLMNDPRSLKEHVDAEFAKTKSNAEIAPEGQAIGEIIGAPLMPFAGPLARYTVSGGGRLVNALRGAGVGAGTGFVYGTGQNTSNIDDRLISGLITAPLGAVIGAVGGGVLSPLGAKSAADEKVAQALVRDYGSLDEAAPKIAENLRTLGPRATLMEAGGVEPGIGGQNVRNLARSIHTMEGEGQGKIGNFLTRRQVGEPTTASGSQADAFQQKIREEFTRRGKNYYENADELQQIMNSEAGPLYREAGVSMDPKLPISNYPPVPIKGEFKRILDLPEMQPAWEAAISNARVADRKLPTIQVNDPQTGKLVSRPVPDMQALHEMKIALDDIITTARPGSPQADTAKYRAYLGLKKRFVELLDEANPKYAAARAVAGDVITNRNAADLGKEFLKLKPEEMQSAIKEFSPAEMMNFKTGVFQALKDAVGKARLRNDAVGQFDTKDMADKIRMLFKTEDAADFRQFVHSLMREAETRQYVTGGSATVNKAQDLTDLGTKSAADLALGNKIGAGARLLGRLHNYASMPNEAARSQMADKLIMQNPADILAYVNALRARGAVPSHLQKYFQGASNALVE